MYNDQSERISAVYTWTILFQHSNKSVYGPGMIYFFHIYLNLLDIAPRKPKNNDSSMKFNGQ